MSCPLHSLHSLSLEQLHIQLQLRAVQREITVRARERLMVGAAAVQLQLE